jgi:hypothetical protein
MKQSVIDIKLLNLEDKLENFATRISNNNYITEIDSSHYKALEILFDEYGPEGRTFADAFEGSDLYYTLLDLYQSLKLNRSSRLVKDLHLIQKDYNEILEDLLDGKE